MAEGAIDFVSGTIGGVCGVAAGQPFDTVKVLMQLGGGRDKVATIGGTARFIFRNYGWKGFFKGMLSPMAGVAAMNATVFWGYGFAERTLRRQQNLSKDEVLPLMDVYWAGCLGGLAQSFVCSPAELLKVRLQSFKGGYHGPLDVARHIVKTEGPLRLFNGLGATILRDTPSYGLYFTVYEAIDRQLSDFSAPFRAIVGGGFTGVLTWLSVYPVDVIKSRIQAGQAWSIKELYYSGSLFRGMLPCLVRAFPVNAVTFLFYTSIKRFLTIEFL